MAVNKIDTMSVLVTIIIPVYNGSRFIASSIGSALSQTYPSIEVIVVNDGSTDDSLTIAQSITDSRLTVIDQSNSGVTAARLTGLSHASGDWICFLDADDTLPVNAIEEYSKEFVSNPEIIVSDCNCDLSNEDYLAKLLRLSVRPELWGKLFRTDFVKNTIPCLDRTIVMGEDLLQNLVIGMNAHNIVTIPSLLYRINNANPESVTKVFRHSYDYETIYFDLLDQLFLSRCHSDKVIDSAFWLKLNGMKQVVLDGNSFDCGSELWKSIKSHYSRDQRGLGISEKALLMCSNKQKIYRMIMRAYLRIANFINK